MLPLGLVPSRYDAPSAIKTRTLDPIITVNPHIAALDHRLKFGRAFHHLQELKEAETAWLRADSHSLRMERDPKTRDMSFFATVTQQPDRDPFALIVGDCLHNLRSCLDLLAYELGYAFRKPLPDAFAEKSEFPIFGDVDKRGRSGVGPSLFRDYGRPKIKGWDPKAQAVVEGLQPYQRGSAFVDDPLYILHDLDRISKHRLLHTVAAGSKGIGIIPSKSNATIGPGVIESMGGLVDSDTPVARFPNVRAADPRREVHIEITPALCIAFATNTPYAAEEPVYQFLINLYFYLGATVLPPLEVFL